MQHVDRPGIEPRPLALETRHLSHWTAREVPIGIFGSPAAAYYDCLEEKRVCR